MRIFFLFLLLFARGHASAQFSLQQFEDYSQCTVGLKDRRTGEIIHEAIYSSIEYATWYTEDTIFYYYLVEKDYHRGLLDIEGNFLIPCKYDSISLLDMNHVILGNQGEWMVSDIHGNQIGEESYEHIAPFHYHGFYHINKGRRYVYQPRSETPLLVMRNGKYGVVNSKFEWIIHAKYDGLKLKHIRRQPFGTPYIAIVKDGKVGACDTNGRELVTPQYQNLYALEPAINSTELIFHVTDSNGRIGVIQNNKIIVPLAKQLIEWSGLLKRYNYYDKYIPSCVITSTKNNIAVYSLISGNKLDNLTNAIPFADHVLFETKKGWGIADPSLRILSSENNKIPSISSFKFQGFPEFSEYGREYWTDYQEGDESVQTLQPEDGVIFICNAHTYRRAGRRNNRYKVLTKLGSRGLLNYKTGKKTPLKYQTITQFGPRKDMHYWAMYPAKLEKNFDSTYTVDIYNSKLELTATYNFYTRDYYEQYTPTLVADTLPFYLAQTPNGWPHWKGLVKYNGELFLPFEYRVNAGYFSDKHLYARIPDYYIIGNASEVGLLNKFGEKVIPIQYDNISYNKSNKQFFLKTGESYIILDQHLNVLLENVTKIFGESWLDYWGDTERSTSSYSYRSRRTDYYISDGKLHIQDEDSIAIMDKYRINYKSDNEKFFDKYHVNSQGIILDQFLTKATKLKSNNGYYYLKDGTLSLFDNNWKEQIKLDNVNSYMDCHHRFYVRFANGMSALYSAKSLQLLFQTPEPGNIYPKSVYDQTSLMFYWVQATKSRNRTWTLYQEDGAVIDSLYNYPVSELTTVTQKDGKYGLLDENGKVVLPHEYQYIYEQNGLYFLRKDGLWGTYLAAKKKLNKPRFENISLHKINGNFVVFQGDKFGLVDDDFKEIMPLTLFDEVIQNKDVFKLSGSPYKYLKAFGGFKTTGFPEVLRRLSNSSLIENQLINSVENQALTQSNNKGISCFKLPGVQNIVYGTNQTKIEYTHLHATKNFYSARKETQTWHIGTDGASKQVEFTNYRTEGQSLISIRLSALFKSGEAGLRSILTDVFTEKQSFGIACPNLDAILSEIQTQFVVTDYGIFIYHDSLPKNRLFIQKESLESHLKYSDIFL